VKDKPMDLYYFVDADENPEVEADWDIWNIIIPLKSGTPRTNDKVIIFNYDTGIEQFHDIGERAKIAEWPFRFPEKMMQHTMKTIFEVK